MAVRIELADGGHRFVLTWGRIFDPVDPHPLEQVVLRHCRRFALGGDPISATVCASLREAADSSYAPYFHEHLLWFAWHPVPFGPTYQTWRADREAALEAGQELRYCGQPFGESTRRRTWT